MAGIVFDGCAEEASPIVRGPKRPISGRDQALLGWYFSQYAFEKSTFGATLARQEARYLDSSGKVIPRPDSWVWVSSRAKRPQHRASRGVEVNAILGIDRGASHDPPMYVSEDTTGVVHEPDNEDMIRHADASRRLMLTSRLGNIHTAVLGAYYGNDGTAWQGFSNGRIWSLSALTETGTAALLKAGTGHVIPAKYLAEHVKGANVEKIQREGEALLVAAEAAWRATAPPPKARREYADARADRRERRARLGLVLL